MDAEIKKALDGLGIAVTEMRAANDKRLAEIEAKGAASAELVAKVEAANADITKFQKQIADIEKAQKEHETVTARLEATAGAGKGGGKRARALAKAVSTFYAQVKPRAQGDFTPRPEPSADEVKAYQDFRSVFARYVREPGDRYGTPNAPIRAAMTTGTDPEGGYAVPPDLGGRIVQLMYVTSPMRQFANIRQTSRREVIGRNDLAESGGGWVGEQTGITETAAPGLGQWKIPVLDLYAEPRVTQDELDDADFDVETWLVSKIANKLGRLENTAFVVGNGIAKPRGFLDYASGTPSATGWNVIERVGTGVSGDFAAAPNGGDVFIDLIGKMKVPYRQGSVFFMNRGTQARARKLKDSQGHYVWQPSFVAAVPDTIAGYPNAIFEDMPDVAAASLSVALANFGEGYQIVDRRGITLLRDPYTAKPFIKFYTTKRTGGDVVNFEAIKLALFS
jgi:HK97 family phage major capsid protein